MDICFVCITTNQTVHAVCANNFVGTSKGKTCCEQLLGTYSYWTFILLGMVAMWSGAMTISEQLALYGIVLRYRRSLRIIEHCVTRLAWSE